MVMLLGAILAIFSAALLTLFQINTKFMVKENCMLMKQELANLALDQTLFKLQQNSYWSIIADKSATRPPDLAKYIDYSNPFTTSLGEFKVHVVAGNLFKDSLSDPNSPRQGVGEFCTIGIKVKTSPTNCVASYYAVVQLMKFGGPLVSKGFINLPCTDAKINDSNFFWGDIYSGNTMTGYFRIPYVPVANSATNGGKHEEWLPKVFSAADIYTAVGYQSSGRTGSYQYASTYDDMSPTANCHPYSQFANVPEIDLQSYKDMATKQGNYYGPQYIQLPGGGNTLNSNYINDGKHDNYTGGSVTNDVTNANILKIMHSLNSPSSVVFIDTTDGLPARWTTSTTCNTYSGSLTVTANDNSLKFYVSSSNQYMTSGMLFIQGPLVLAGNTPSNITYTAGYAWGYGYGVSATADNVANVLANATYYYPQGNDSLHYTRNLANDSLSFLSHVKHYGLIYAGGELQIGGGTEKNSSGQTINTTNSNICIYGSIYLGPLGELSMDTINDANTKLYVYYNTNLNFFSMQTNSLQVVSFSEISFLVPTVVPTY
jgi:hypothetical protein